MELRLLKYFWTVATAGTVSKAAEQLYITQPTLSRQIKELERELDTQLFMRDGKKLILTEDGQFLKIKAEEILQLTSKTVQVFEDRKNAELSGHLTIGALEGWTTSSIAKTLQRLTNKYPSITFTILSGNADDIKWKIDNGLVDVGFLLEPTSTEKYNVEKIGFPERWMMLTQSDSELAELDEVSPEIFKKQRILISERPEVRQFIADWAGCQAVVTEGALIRDYPDLKAIPLSPEVKTLSVLAWKKNIPLTPLTRAFIKQYLQDNE